MTPEETEGGAERQTVLLSVDFEDWHQLVRRRVGAGDWDRPGPALGRQSERLLGLLAELDVRATFFILGMTARAHPQLLEPIIQAGHEVGCHGDAHRPVSGQTPPEFGEDLDAARATIEELTGHSPLGYRAPAFSITREVSWAYQVLAEHGFAYDASQHDSPRIRDRVAPAAAEPYPLELAGGASLWEFPAAVWRPRGAPVPVGGASYWAVMPSPLVLHGLRRAGMLPGLYLHPHEFDPEPLNASLGMNAPLGRRAHGVLRAAQRNTARRGAENVLRAIARSFRLIPYGEAYARLSGGAPARP
jgi:polysaccharide deacetylase family protein (PEP-CTERM system associated)